MGDRGYDLVPGDSDDSILAYRRESIAAKLMMPKSAALSFIPKA
jgi:hypothetical protein